MAVAVVLLGVILLTLAGVTYRAAAQAVETAGGAEHRAVAVELVNRLTAMPYDSIPKPASRCDTVRVAGPADGYRRCLSVSPPRNRQVTVRVAVTPLHAGSLAQHYEFIRSAPAGPNPLKLP